MNNIDIRQEVKESGFYLWQVAKQMGIADYTFSRKLRQELSAEEKSLVRKAIQKLKNNSFKDNVF